MLIQYVHNTDDNNWSFLEWIRWIMKFRVQLAVKIGKIVADK